MPYKSYAYVSAQSCLTLWDPMGCIVHEVPLSVEFFQARRLEWVAVSSSRGSSQHGDRTLMTLNLLH